MMRGSHVRASLIALLALWSVTAQGLSQSPTAQDPFARIRFLIGRWEGTSDGKPGKATVRREYAPALNGRFIQVQNRSEYAPQERNPKGEIHEDHGWFSYDRGRKRIVFRQFHVEGFVNQYVEEPAAGEPGIVFTTEAIENIPAGWRAREIYIVHGPDDFEEIFELSEAGKPFELYSRARFTRVK